MHYFFIFVSWVCDNIRYSAWTFLPVIFGVKNVRCCKFFLFLTAETRLSAISSPVSTLPKVKNQPSSFPRGNRGLCTFCSLALVRSSCTISVYSWSACTWIQFSFVGGCLKCLSSSALLFSHHPRILMSTFRTGILQRTLCIYVTEDNVVCHKSVRKLCQSSTTWWTWQAGVKVAQQQAKLLTSSKINIYISHIHLWGLQHSAQWFFFNAKKYSIYLASS